MRSSSLLALSFIAVAASCQPSPAAVAPTTTPTTTPTTAPAAAGNTEAVRAFHEVLRPLWHAPPGAERQAKTCASADRLRALAIDIRTARPDIAAAAQTLVAAVESLQQTCVSTPSSFDAAFTHVHDSFHGVAEACRD